MPEGVTLLDPIEVTAGGRLESSREVPASITALRGEQLESMGSRRFDDFAYFVPGLNWEKFDRVGGQLLVLRGISTGSNDSATVGIYVDDVPIGSSSAFANGGISLDLATFDLDRIEVLHGPQGTLYGASTLGGLLKYVTRDPQPGLWSTRLASEISVTQQGAPSYAARGVFNVPLAESPWALRIGLSRIHDGGFIASPALGRQDTNASDTDSVRAVVRGPLTENLTLRLSALYQRIEAQGLSLTERDLMSHEPRRGPYDHNNRFPEPAANRVPIVSAALDLDLGWARLLSASNLQAFRTHSLIDETDLADAVLHTGETVPTAILFRYKVDKWVQELRLQSPPGDRVEWIAGAFATAEKGIYDGIVYRADTRSGDVFNPGDLAPEPLPVTISGVRFYDFHSPSRFNEYAGFGDLTWTFSENLDVTLGGRYAHNVQDLRQVSSGVLDGDPVMGTNSHQMSQENSVTWLVNPRWRFGRDSLLYARVATGYRPGGPNLIIDSPTGTDAPPPPVFKQDAVTNYEIGLKTTLPDGRALLDLAVFYIAWRDPQLEVTRNNFVARENGHSARSRGAELAGRYRLTDAWTLGLTLAALDAKLTADAPAVPARKGEKLPLVADFSGTATADYGFGLPWGLSGRVFASYRYMGTRESSFQNDAARPRYTLSPYRLLDLRLSANAPNQFSVSLFGTNLLNQIGEVGATSTFAGSDASKPVLVNITQPRTIGVSASYDF